MPIQIRPPTDSPTAPALRSASLTAPSTCFKPALAPANRGPRVASSRNWTGTPGRPRCAPWAPHAR
eukprot:9477321-Pyramimonas_sp.AAC.1